MPFLYWYFLFCADTFFYDEVPNYNCNFKTFCCYCIAYLVASRGHIELRNPTQGLTHMQDRRHRVLALSSFLLSFYLVLKWAHKDIEKANMIYVKPLGMHSAKSHSFIYFLIMGDLFHLSGIFSPLFVHCHPWFYWSLIYLAYFSISLSQNSTSFSSNWCYFS